MKPFQKKVKKKIPEILEDIVTKGDLSLTKEVLDKQKIAKVVAGIAGANDTLNVLEKVTKEGVEAQFNKANSNIKYLEKVQKYSEDGDYDDYDYTEEYCSNEKNNKIKFIFISIIIFLIVVFLISKYTMIL